MEKQEVKFVLHYPDMQKPFMAYEAAAGFDLTAVKIEAKQDNVFLVDTGVSLEAPQEYYCQIYLRSSMYKKDFILANGVGIIDNDYRGIIYMPLRYVGKNNAWQEAQALIGERVGQVILQKQCQFNLEQVSELTITQRGGQGFGSTSSTIL